MEKLGEFFGNGWPEIDKGKLNSFPSLSRTKEGPVGGTQQALTNQSIWLRGLDLNQRPSGYEPVGQTLSLAVSVALTPATVHFHPKFGGIPCPKFA